MNTADVAVIVILLISGLFALIRGFVKEVLGVAAWVGAAFATLYLFHWVTPWFRGFIAVPWLADGAAGVTIFVIALVILSAGSHAIAHRVHQSHFSTLDKSLGLVFGLLRGAVVVCLGYLALGWAFSSADQYPSWVRGARTMPIIERGAKLIEQLIPESARHRGAQAVNEAATKARQGLEAKRDFDQLSQPAPKADTPKEHEGYNRDEIKDMNRLFQSTQ
ncbi:MAG TPA: CvpA family protein [Alphaproteobacteria bacterium]|nr:CvpA family protein [Alphaproteobacteria bacterium]